MHWHLDRFIAHYQTNVGDVCYAESRDGLRWSKPLIGAKPLGVAGTNIVVSAVYSEGMDGNIVQQDWNAPPAERFKMFTMPYKNNNHSRMHFEILASPDGKVWRSIVSKTGPAEDRSTAYYNPFRRKWVFSVKSSWNYPPIGRARSYWETDDLRHSTWTCLPGDDSPSNSRTCSGAAEPVPWIGADEHDPRCVYNLTVTDPPNAESPVAANCTVGGVGWNMCDAPAQLYNLDVFAHESVLVGLFAVFRGFYDGGGFQRTSGELNSIYLGFSRDGFTWHRPLPRKPFLEQSWPEHSWRNNDVQSVGGGVVVLNDTMHIYASGHSGLPQDLEGTGGNGSMGLATLGRDRFVSLVAVMSGQPGELLTRPLVFDKSQVRLFVNVRIPRGGFLQAQVCDTSSRPVAGFGFASSTVAGVPVGSVAAATIDSTRLEVHWPQSLASVAGKPLRLRFRFAGASLFAFWTSSSACGHSDGFVSGPAGVDGVDTAGSCGSEPTPPPAPPAPAPPLPPAPAPPIPSGHQRAVVDDLNPPRSSRKSPDPLSCFVKV